MSDIETQDVLEKALHSSVASQLLLEANDLCLVIDADGVIQNTNLSSNDASLTPVRDWIGRRWIDTVTGDSRSKIKDLLSATEQPSRWRQANHRVNDSADLPINWKVLKLGDDGSRLAIGRNLRQVSQLQQRLLDVQNSLERDYARLNQAEVRYRMLFSLATEAILFVDADSRKIVEANPAAGRLLDKPANKLLNRNFPRGFTDNSNDAIEELLLRVRAAGGAEDLIVKVAHNDQAIRINATLVRREDGPYFLVRMHAPEHGIQNTYSSQILEIINRSPDAFVVTDPDGRVRAANQAFLNLTAMATVLQVGDQPLDRWLGRTGVDVALLIRNLRDRSEIRSYDTTVYPEFGEPIDVELSGVSALDSDDPSLGFVLRRRAQPAVPSKPAAAELPHSLEEMTELVGRVPLKELVRETTDIIERMCIEAALKMSDQSRAGAAEMLGLSRQSLYVKLRRYDIGDSGDDG